MVKKPDNNTKINEIERKITDHDDAKYITTHELNKLTAENVTVTLEQAKLALKLWKGHFYDKLKNVKKKNLN